MTAATALLHHTLPSHATGTTLSSCLLSQRQSTFQFLNAETLRHLICSEMTSQMRRGRASVHSQLYIHRRWTLSISLRRRQVENRKRTLRFYMNLLSLSPDPFPFRMEEQVALAIRREVGLEERDRTLPISGPA